MALRSPDAFGKKYRPFFQIYAVFVSAYLMVRDSRITFFEKDTFLTMHIFFMLFSLQFHESSTMVGLEMLQTLYKRTLCERSL